MKSVFNLTRLLQPSLVVLEDVDLVFSAREINLYSSVLGELLDQMDGLRLSHLLFTGKVFPRQRYRKARTLDCRVYLPCCPR